MDLCTCNNNTDSTRLRMVSGNDFSTLYTINAKYADDTPVPNWDITQCTDVQIKVHRVVYGKGIDNTKDVSAYGSYRFANTNVLIIDWDGLLMKVGTYSVDFAAKFDGVDVRWYSKSIMAFDIVESNEEANIPEDSFIDEGVYSLDGDFVLMFGVQQQADWNEDDPTQPDYIKNKPEGVDVSELLRKDEAALIYLAKADAHIPEYGGLNTLTNAIDFYDEDDVLLFSVDATAMLKDSRIDDITYSNGYLTFNFNADAEKSPISIFIGDVFSSGNYYDKTASDLRYVTSTTLLDYYTAQEINSLLGAINTSINTINGKIPSAASSSNQLADKAFVNSSISTATATFRGTSATGLTENQFLTWANSLTHDLNDYVYWDTSDSAGNTVYKRYKYNGSAWVFEYDLNNSSFTSAEWAAIQSGVTSSLVTKLSDLPTNSQLTTALGNKQDTIGDLSDIRSGAQAGATAYQLPSGGVPDTDITSASTWNGKQDALVSGTNIKTVNNQSLLGSGNITIEGGGDDNVIESITMNGNAVTITSKTAAIVESDPVFLSSAAYGITSSDIENWNNSPVLGDDDGSAISADFNPQADTVWHKAQTLSSAQKAQARTNIGAQETLTFDSSPTSASTNPVTSGGVYTALGNKQDTLVSGTNIKTVNNTSLLGSGDISISGGDVNVIEGIKMNNAALTPDANKVVDLGTVITAHQDISGKADKATTLAGYGITDAKIANGTITLGSNTITPLTSFTESDPVFSASAASGITSSDITNWNSKTSNVGTITGINMNGASKGTSGVVDLGAVITAHQDISGKADKSEMSVSTSGDQTTITLKSGTSATVINSHQSLSGKQDTLVSGTNIKTINNESILGSGNITIQGGGEANVIESISINGTTQTVTSKNVDLPVPTSADVYSIVKLTQAAYDALATKVSTTLYIITAS